MHARLLHLAAGAGLTFLVALAAALMFSNWSSDGDWQVSARSAGEDDGGSAPDRINTPYTVDELRLIDTTEGFRAGGMRRVSVQGDAVELADTRERSWPKSGQWTSPEVNTTFAFVELVPSWNVLTPPGTGASFDVRVRDAASGEWTEWLYMGSCGRTLTPVSRTIESNSARVKIDEMLLDAPADAYQVRATLQAFTFDPAVTPTLRRVGVVYTGETRDRALLARFRPPAPADRSWARDLAIPFRAQGEPSLPAPLRPQICSPTSVSMVMEHFGVDRPTVENALAIYDPEYRLFGNWNRAVQHAGSLGLDAWIARFRTWDQVKREIARGQPVIASIRFQRGTFPSALYDSTDGHLLVIRGFTPEGDVIVNDPARRKGSDGTIEGVSGRAQTPAGAQGGSNTSNGGDGVVYKAGEFAHAWFDNGGVGYIIRAPERVAASAN